MSVMLYAIIKYEENTSDEAISDSCFDFIREACTEKIAIGMISKKISIWDGENYFSFITPINYILNKLNENEIVIELNNSMVKSKKFQMMTIQYQILLILKG